jgi:NADPH-dependent 2,4-dienoyl-CoA reductase/sulfur reductase-like enzyme
VVVVGAGAAGFELTLALAWGLARLGDGSSRVALVTGGGDPLANYPPGVVARGLRALKRHRVTVLRSPCIGIEPGAADENLPAGAVIRQTQSAVVLENLIGQLVTGKAGEAAEQAGQKK